MIYTHKFDTIIIFSTEKGQKCLSTMWNEQKMPFIYSSVLNCPCRQYFGPKMPLVLIVWFKNAPIVTTWVKHVIFRINILFFFL